MLRSNNPTAIEFWINSLSLFTTPKQDPHINTKVTTVVIVAAALCGCGTSAITPEAKSPAYPDNWQRQADVGTVNSNWLSDFSDDTLNTLIIEALNQNYSLASQAATVEIAAQNNRIFRADRLPRLDLALRRSRGRTVIGSTANTTQSSFTLSADLDFEIDVWGRLSKAQKASHLDLLAAESNYLDSQRVLAANTARQWYNAIEAKQLLSLFENRLQNLTESADIIESGYRQGINEALDVFLAQNSVEQEQASVANQKQLLLENTSNLQRFLARYPDGQMPVSDQLPTLNTDIPVGLPSELVTRRADVQSAWLSLLAADADLAVSHKARFPRLSLSGSTSDTTEEFNDLLDGGSLAWSLVGNLTQPLFDAGRLKALEEQARQRVTQAEKSYLDVLFDAFNEVEDGISRNRLLQDQLVAFQKAEQNADAALELAFDQYQRGLVTYTTVLESQRRAFDAQTTVVRLKNQLLQNRIGLFLSLGGEFEVNQ